MGFLPAEEMSARPMTTVFHHFSRSTAAPRGSAFSTARRASGCTRRSPSYITARGGRIETEARVDGVELDAAGRVAGLRLADGSLRRADAYVLAAPLHSRASSCPTRCAAYPLFDNLWQLKSVPVMNVQIWFDRYVSTVDNLFFTADAPFSVFADLARGGAHPATTGTAARW